jgi:hypothetical protein
MERTYYKLNIQGIVYLVDPTTSLAYTYDLSSPTEIGKVTWTDAKTEPLLVLKEGWAAIQQAKLDAMATVTPA